MDMIMKPVHVATSKPARQTYLNTVLFMIASGVLIGLAAFAYILFYLNYVPQIGIERVIHLQYGDGLHPYGITSLDSSLVSQQAYDISLSLHVPRSPPNLAQGNFMLSLSLMSPNYRPAIPSVAYSQADPISTSTSISPEDLLYSSRRQAILTYTSKLVSLSSQIVALPFYVIGIKKESEVLHIPMGESATFNRGWKNVPGYAMLELQAGQEVQVYDVRLHFKARFSGIRWLMYNYRILSFILFTSAFWGFEVVFAGLSWLILRSIFASDHTKKVDGKSEEENGIKTEQEDFDEPDLSDTPRNFPTYGRQLPLRYEPSVKEEMDSEEYVLDETSIQPLAGEADDEDDDDVGEFGDLRGGRTDSGIGTSFSEGGDRLTARKRSKGGQRSLG